VRFLLCAVLVACGPSAAEIKTATTATYDVDATKLLDIALDAARASYKIAGVDQVHTAFETQGRMYSKSGELESAGAGDVIQYREGSVFVSFIVRVVVEEPHRAVVTVTPKTLQMVVGSPQPRELAPDDLSLPPFVKGRADALAYAIYERAKSYAGAAPK
jgi:hypothetical protein